MRDADVIIVGAGLTGLRAASELCRGGLSVLVFERNSSVGGRMRTDTIGGYKLDHGFQVILTAYPEVKKIRGFPDLLSRSFSSGARIRSRGRFVDFTDPRRHPESILSMMRDPVASLKDYWRLFCLTRGSRRTACQEEERSTIVGLHESGFSENFQATFLKPFLRGVLLDPHLRADFGIARFYLQMFAKGDAVLPHDGIQGLPNLLSELCGRSHVRLNTAVNAISPHEVILENGDTYSAQVVVCAADPLAAAQLGSPEQTLQHVGTATLYFSTQRPPFDDCVVVISSEEGPIATLAVVSNIQPSYAPPGRSLISISVIGEYVSRREEELIAQVVEQATRWYGETVRTWNHLKTYTIPAAVVTRPRLGVGWIEKDGVFYAGDYLSYGSQNGALAAGRTLGESLLERLS